MLTNRNTASASLFPLSAARLELMRRAITITDAKDSVRQMRRLLPSFCARSLESPFAPSRPPLWKSNSYGPVVSRSAEDFRRASNPNATTARGGWLLNESPRIADQCPNNGSKPGQRSGVLAGKPVHTSSVPLLSSCVRNRAKTWSLHLGDRFRRGLPVTKQGENGQGKKQEWSA
jgi:hypothetical protein